MVFSDQTPLKISLRKKFVFDLKSAWTSCSDVVIIFIVLHLSIVSCLKKYYRQILCCHHWVPTMSCIDRFYLRFQNSDDIFVEDEITNTQRLSHTLDKTCGRIDFYFFYYDWPVCDIVAWSMLVIHYKRIISGVCVGYEQYYQAI